MSALADVLPFPDDGPDDAQEPGPIQEVVVVGALGQMGAAFADLCARAGVTVRPLDRPLSQSGLRAACCGADLVMLAVPIVAMAEVLRKVVPHLDGRTILADCCSVKMRPMEQMLAAYAGPVVGTHPLFGGNLPTPEERRVAVTSGNRPDDSPAAEAVSAWLTRLKCVPFATTARDHDRAMAMIQGLNFVTSVSYLACTAQRPQIEEFLTPSFKRRLTAARKMLTQDNELFETLFETNPESQDAVRSFSAYLSVAAGGDVNLLVERAGWWWRQGGPFTAGAEGPARGLPVDVESLAEDGVDAESDPAAE